MMPSIVCADAGLALKLVFPEADSARARALWDEWRLNQTTVVAPILWGYEVTLVVRNRVHRRLFPAADEEITIETLHQLPVHLLYPAMLHRHAAQFARRFNRSAAYDAHYLALAEMLNCPFWTADERLFNAVHNDLSWCQWLGNYSA